MDAADLIRVLNNLKEAKVGAEATGDLKLGDPLIEDLWREYLVARRAAEEALEDFVWHEVGVRVSVDLSNIWSPEEEDDDME